MTRPAPYTPERQLPEGDEIQRMRTEGQTFAEIGERYGVTRQAVHKALATWKRRQERKVIEGLVKEADQVAEWPDGVNQKRTQLGA